MNTVDSGFDIDEGNSDKLETNILDEFPDESEFAITPNIIQTPQWVKKTYITRLSGSLSKIIQYLNEKAVRTNLNVKQMYIHRTMAMKCCGDLEIEWETLINQLRIEYKYTDWKMLADSEKIWILPKAEPE